MTTALLIGIFLLMMVCLYIGFDDWRAARRMRKERDR